MEPIANRILHCISEVVHVDIRREREQDHLAGRTCLPSPQSRMGTQQSTQTPGIVARVHRDAARVVAAAPPDIDLPSLYGQLASELKWVIAFQLDPIDITRLALTNKENKDLLINGMFWRTLCFQHYRSPFAPHEPLRGLVNIAELFKRMALTARRKQNGPPVCSLPWLPTMQQGRGD